MDYEVELLALNAAFCQEWAKLGFEHFEQKIVSGGEEGDDNRSKEYLNIIDT